MLTMHLLTSDCTLHVRQQRLFVWNYKLPFCVCLCVCVCRCRCPAAQSICHWANRSDSSSSVRGWEDQLRNRQVAFCRQLARRRRHVTVTSFDSHTETLSRLTEKRREGEAGGGEENFCSASYISFILSAISCVDNLTLLCVCLTH